MRPNGRNRDTNPNRNRDYIEETDEKAQRDYQNYGSEYDEPETGPERGGGGRYGSGQSRSEQYPSSGYYNRYDDYGSDSRGSRNQGFGQRGSYGQSQRPGQRGDLGSNQGYGRSGNYDQGYRSGRENQQDFDSDYYYGRGNYAPQSGSGWRENQSYGSRGMGYGDAEEQGRYGYRSGSQQSEQQGRHFGKGPKGYQRSDERIKEDVNEALSRHWDLDASDIEVQVQNGEVTLTGTVDSREAKRYAEDAAERSFGVKDVENKLKVKKETNSSWSTEIDTGSSSSKTGSKSGESTSMGDVRRGAGSTSGSRS